MDSFNPTGATGQQPPSNSSNPFTTSRQAPSDTTGISHPTTYEPESNYGSNANIRPSASEPLSAAALQSKTTTSGLNSHLSDSSRQNPSHSTGISHSTNYEPESNYGAGSVQQPSSHSINPLSSGQTSSHQNESNYGAKTDFGTDSNFGAGSVQQPSSHSSNPLTSGQTPSHSTGISHEPQSNYGAGSTQEPLFNSGNPFTNSRQTPSDTTGISHPTTYEPESNYGSNANVRPSASEPLSAAALQGKTTTPGSHSTTAPSTSKRLDTETHVPSHHGDAKEKLESAVDEDAEISHKPRKDHETTTREIKATQAKAMAGTHPAEKQGEALRVAEEREEAKAATGAGHSGLEHPEEHRGEHQHEEGSEHHKVGLKEKLLAKVHKH